MGKSTKFKKSKSDKDAPLPKITVALDRPEAFKQFFKEHLEARQNKIASAKNEKSIQDVLEQSNLELKRKELALQHISAEVNHELKRRELEHKYNTTILFHKAKEALLMILANPEMLVQLPGLVNYPTGSLKFLLEAEGLQNDKPSMIIEQRTGKTGKEATPEQLEMIVRERMVKIGRNLGFDMSDLMGGNGSAETFSGQTNETEH